MGFKVAVEIAGLKEILGALAAAEAKVRRKLIKKAVGQAGKLILKAAKSNLKGRRTGQLRRSLGRKVKVYRGSGVAVAIVGPRKGFKTQDEWGNPVDPINYAHLVEYGRRAVFAGENTRRFSDGTVRKEQTGKKLMRFRIKGKLVFAWKSAAVPARPFMRPALDNNVGAIRNIMVTTIRAGLSEQGEGPSEGD